MSLPFCNTKKDRGQKPCSARGHRCCDERLLRSSTDPIWADYGKGPLRRSAARPAAAWRSCGCSCTCIYPRFAPTHVGIKLLWGKPISHCKHTSSSPPLSSARKARGEMPGVVRDEVRDEQRRASATISGARRVRLDESVTRAVIPSTMSNRAHHGEADG